MRGSPYEHDVTAKLRWMGAGDSSLGDARAAGAGAAAAARQGPDPRLVVVFCSDSYDLPALLGGIRDVTGDTPLVGCSTAGEIASSGPHDASVVVVILGGTGFSIATAVGRDASFGLHAAGEQAASCVQQVEPREHVVLLLLSDGLTGDQQELVRGAYSVAGAACTDALGEIARTRGVAGFHNQTLVVLAVAG